MQQQTAQLAEQVTERPPAEGPVPNRDYIGIYAELLRKQLQHMSATLWKPTAQKQLRRFTSGEAARLLGISDSRLRQLSLEGNGPQPEITGNGRRSYSLADIHLMREYLDGTTNTGKRFSPRRRGEEHLQVVAVTNFKGGSAKTTTSAHLAQYLALQGYRVLAVDLDAQASMSALLGIQPELDVGGGETLYASIQYDEDQRRPLKEVIRETYFSGLHLVPGNLELTEFEHDTPRALAGGGRGAMFFTRIQDVLASVDDDFDVVVIDCPPQLGFLTLSALTAATTVLITVHPQMLDVASMSQFLTLTDDLLEVVGNAGGQIDFDSIRFLLTRFEPQDGPQSRVAALLRHVFGEAVLVNPMLKSAAVSDAGLTKQTLYEIARESMSRGTYDRALESLEAVNGEIEGIIRRAWGRTA